MTERPSAEARGSASTPFVFLVLLGLVWVLVATALESWTGRLLLVVVVGGGGWLAVRGFRWWHEHTRIHAESLRDLLSLTPASFEHAVAQLLRDQGYRSVRATGKAGDHQADVTAVSPDGEAVVVQCKRYAPDNPVGSPAVQSFIGMAHVHHRAPVGMVVTTSRFTGPARELAGQHGIRLIDGNELVRLVVRENRRADAMD